MDNKIKDTEYLNVLNVISMIAVVTIHTNGCFWEFSTERYWFTANIIESILYFAVPIFFMITGATLVDYTERYDDKIYFAKRIKKTLIPFLAWSVIGLVFKLSIGWLSLGDVSLKYVVNDIISNKYMPIYWFFIPLFSVYLAMPLFAHVREQDKKNVFIYLVIIGMIVNITLPFVRKFYNWVPHNNGLRVEVVSNYLLYVLIGWLLSNYEMDGIKRLIIYGLSVVGLLMHMVGTYHLSMKIGAIDKTYKDHINLPCLLYSVGIFVIIKSLSPHIIKISIFRKLVNLLNKYTFSIYLMHWFAITCIRDIFDLNIYSIWYRLGLPFIIIPICILIIWIMRKIPIIKYIVP